MSDAATGDVLRRVLKNGPPVIGRPHLSDEEYADAIKEAVGQLNHVIAFAYGCGLSLIGTVDEPISFPVVGRSMTHSATHPPHVTLRIARPL